MLAQSDEMERLSSHRQHLTPSILVGVGLLVDQDCSFWVGFVVLVFVCLFTYLVLCYCFDTKSCFVALKLLILLPQSPKCWGVRPVLDSLSASKLFAQQFHPLFLVPPSSMVLMLCRTGFFCSPEERSLLNRVSSVSHSCP